MNRTTHKHVRDIIVEGRWIPVSEFSSQTKYIDGKRLPITECGIMTKPQKTITDWKHVTCQACLKQLAVLEVMDS